MAQLDKHFRSSDIYDNFFFLFFFFDKKGKYPTRQKKRPDVLRTSPYGPLCNAKGRISSRTSLLRAQDVNLTVIHKMVFYGISSTFPDSNCTSDSAQSK